MEKIATETRRGRIHLLGIGVGDIAVVPVFHMANGVHITSKRFSWFGRFPG